MQIKRWLSTSDRLKQLAAQRLDLSIPELQLLTDDRWTMVAAQTSPTSDVETDAGLRRTFGTLRMQAENNLIPRLHFALNAYLKASAGVLPESLTQLLPHFEPALAPEMLSRYELLATGQVSDLPVTIATMRSSPRKLSWIQSTTTSDSSGPPALAAATVARPPPPTLCHPIIRPRLLLFAVMLVGVAGADFYAARVVSAQRTRQDALRREIAGAEHQLDALRAQNEITARDLRLAEQQLAQLPAPAAHAAEASAARETEIKDWVARAQPAGIAQVVPYIDPPFAPSVIEALLSSDRERGR